MTAPLWLLRNQFAPYGHRLPKVVFLKYEKAKPPVKYGSFQPRETYCGVCNTPIIWGVNDSVYRNGNHYHKACSEKKEAYGTHDWRARVEGRQEVVFTPIGNLSDSEYRFWMGDINPSSMVAICRACKTACFTPKERLLHKSDKSHWTKNTACTVRLTEAYRSLLLKGKCQVCGDHTSNSHWGVPLCGKTSCEYMWKFGGTPFMALSMELCQGNDKVVVITEAE